jgi:hypothetical protein
MHCGVQLIVMLEEFVFYDLPPRDMVDTCEDTPSSGEALSRATSRLDLR